MCTIPTRQEAGHQGRFPSCAQRRGCTGLAGTYGRRQGPGLALSIFSRESYGQKISSTIKISGREVHIKKDVKDAINNKLAYVSGDRKNYGLVLIKGYQVEYDPVRHEISFPRTEWFSMKMMKILAAEDYQEN